MKIRSGSLEEIEYCSKVLIFFVGKSSLALFLFYKHYQQVKDFEGYFAAVHGLNTDDVANFITKHFLVINDLYLGK